MRARAFYLAKLPEHQSGDFYRPDVEDQTTSATLTEAADVVLSVGAAMTRAGNTASRTREWGEAVSVSLSLDSITASLRQSGASTTTMREIGSPGINAIHIAALGQLAKTAGLRLARREIAVKLAEIESTTPPLDSVCGLGCRAVSSITMVLPHCPPLRRQECMS